MRIYRCDWCGQNVPQEYQLTTVRDVAPEYETGAPIADLCEGCYQREWSEPLREADDAAVKRFKARFSARVAIEDPR